MVTGPEMVDTTANLSFVNLETKSFLGGFPQLRLFKSKDGKLTQLKRNS